ncbi:MAG: hypothetical protein EPO08_13000 [Rhodospirillaceae bacterium]|nr:MAG: hypothetical protein EPO08_13000 [Rhodospirillaceae bacterium]
MTVPASRRTRSQGEIVVILAANETKTVARAGRSYLVIDITTDGVVLIGMSQQPTDFLRKAVGDSVSPDENDFSELQFLNTSAGAVTVTIKTSFGQIVDNRLNLVSGSIPVTGVGNFKVDDQGADGITDTADAALAAGATLAIAANANRKALMVFNPPSSTGNLKWGNAPDATHGIPITPGSLGVIPVTGAFSIYNSSANAITPNIITLTHT